MNGGKVKEELADDSLSAFEEISCAYEIKDALCIPEEQLNDTNDYSLQIKSEILDIEYGIGNDDFYIKLEPIISEEVHVKTEDDEPPFEGFQLSEHFTCVICNNYKSSVAVTTVELHEKCQENNLAFKGFSLNKSFTVSAYLNGNDLQQQRMTPNVKSNFMLESNEPKQLPKERKPFECRVCDYSCMHKSTLQRHIQTHTGEKPFKCDVCGYSCTWKSNLVRHVQAHIDQKPFKCDVCDYSSAHKIDVQRHIRSHNGEKPFKCDVCGFSCTRKTRLKAHVLKKNHLKVNYKLYCLDSHEDHSKSVDN